MSNENDAEQPNEAQQQQQAPQPHDHLVQAHLEETNKYAAIHEAGHAVIYDDLNWTVIEVEIQPHRRTLANSAEFIKAFEATDWLDDEAKEKIRPQTLDFVTMLVAGHLAENLHGKDEKRISTRLKEKPEVMEQLIVDPQADRDRVVYYLGLFNYTPEEMIELVIQLEARAEDILTRREPHLKTLAKLLEEKLLVNGEDLNKALGKEGA
jgi:hypothetical protein